MKFKNQFHEEGYNRVAGLLKEIFGEMYTAVDDEPVFLVKYGSAQVIVSLFPWGSDDCVVDARAFLVCETEIVPDLMMFLLRENNSKILGAFGLDSDNNIFFEHSIRAINCSKEDLKATVLTVAYTADEFDDLIVSRWGGKRATD